MCVIAAVLPGFLLKGKRKKDMPANRSTSFPYRGRTDDVMKLLMIGFEGLFHFCNPSAVMGWHAIGGQSWSRFLDLTDEYPDQTGAAISIVHSFVSQD